MLQGQTDRSARSIDGALSTYLDGSGVRNILTPGEFSEWPLTLREGQVVIAEAWSDSFDPAIEMTTQEKVLFSNDDRYPGDQRPLMLWRSGQAGVYALRVRSFRDKAGGPFFLRMRVYDCVDLADGGIDTDVPKDRRFLFRVPMKTGEIKRIVIESPDRGGYAGVSLGPTISPFGLPDIGLANPLRVVVPDAVMAPMDGDYYVVGSTAQMGLPKLRAVVRNVLPLRPALPEDALPAKIPTNVPAVWAFSVKAGETLEAAAPELDAGAAYFVVAEQPEMPEYDETRPETNPFFPQPLKAKTEGPAFTLLPARARDNRVLVLAARRNAALWIASNAGGKPNGEFTLTVKPAAREFAAQLPAEGRLAIGRTDYWTFEGEAGDVMTFRAGAADFVQRIVVRDPDFAEIWSGETALDRSVLDWNLIVRKPGRYLVAVSCAGDGGSGAYTLSRKVSVPREFSKAAPAQGTLAAGGVDVWKFTARPEAPLLVRWTSSDWSYTIGVQNERGAPAALQLEEVNPENAFAILRVPARTTFLLVLTSNGGSARYSIGLTDLPVAEIRQR
jgi:hypothetical protein